MKTVPVKIIIKRTKTGPEGHVDPDVVEIVLKDKDDVQWNLESDYPDASADIEKKNPHDDWPFVPGPPKDIKKGNPKKSGKTKSRPKKHTRYNVNCRVMDGTTPIEFVIDPDIIIIGGFDS